MLLDIAPDEILLLGRPPFIMRDRERNRTGHYSKALTLENAVASADSEKERMLGGGGSGATSFKIAVGSERDVCGRVCEEKVETSVSWEGRAGGTRR